MINKNLTRKRNKALREGLRSANLDGYMITNVKNVYYFTGFLDISEAVLCLITPLEGENILLVPSLSSTAASEQAKDCIIKMIKPREKVLEKVVEELQSLKLKHVGFDEMYASTYLKFTKKLKKVKFKHDADMVWKLRRIKSDEEILYMKRAAELTNMGMEAALEAIKPGVREYEVAAEAEYAMRKKGSEGVAFETVIASGPRSAYPHGVCTDRVIHNQDIIIIDLGAVYRGYRSDLTRTTIVGSPSQKQLEVFNLVLKAQEEAFHHIRAGVKTKDIDKTAREIIEKGGYGKYFVHGLGHGVGLDIHEPPSLSQTSKETLEEGNVVTDEPAVYIPNFGGVRIEDTVFVQKNGAERLTRVSRDLK